MTERAERRQLQSLYVRELKFAGAAADKYAPTGRQNTTRVWM